MKIILLAAMKHFFSRLMSLRRLNRCRLNRFVCNPGPYFFADIFFYLGATVNKIGRFFTRIAKFFAKDKNIYLTKSKMMSLPSEVVVAQNSIVYFPLAKCGNTSIKLMLIHAYGPEGCVLQHYKSLTRDQYKTMYTFTVVRNPYARLVSAYVYLKSCRNITLGFQTLHTNLKDPYYDFKTFIGAITQIPTAKRDEHYATLSDLLLNNDHFIIDFDKIIKLENLKEELAALKDKIAIKYYEYTNWTEKKQYKYFYDMDTFLLAKEYSKKDVALLGYQQEEEELYQWITRKMHRLAETKSGGGVGNKA